MTDILNIIRREIESYMSGRFSKRYGEVTSWDPDNHMAKVKIQPEGQESGWLKVRTNHVGNGWGMVVGLTEGDQVSLQPQEGDFDTLEIVGVVHSEDIKPPRAESGEIVLKHASGGFLKIAKDGSMSMTDAGGASITHDGSGKTTHNSPGGLSMGTGGNMTIQGTVNIN